MDIETSDIAQKNTLLMYGYFRMYLNSDMPSDLVGLLKSFCECIKSCNFKGMNLYAFLSFKNGEMWKSKTFRLGDIKLQIQLYPNGTDPKTKGYVQFHLLCKSMPSNIEYIALNYELFCDATHCNLKRTSRFVSGIYTNLHKYNLKTLDLKHKSSVRFEAFVDIQFIQYKDKNDKSIKQESDQ
eukprot:290932_1